MLLRAINCLVDTLSVGCLYMLLFIALIRQELREMEAGGFEAIEVWFTLYFVLLFALYYIVLERFFGKTLGKVITKTRVVSYENKRPTFAQIVLRTVIRLIGIDPFSFLFGAQKGWHDLGSNTLVVRIE